MATQAELMKAYRPRRPGTTLEDVVTPEERARRAQIVQDAKDQAMQLKVDKAYEEAKTIGHAKGGVTRADGCITKGHTRGRMV
jgi:hypothetical protein